VALGDDGDATVLAALNGTFAARGALADAALAVAGFAALGDDGEGALAAFADAALVILLEDGDGDLFGDFLRAAELNILTSIITSIKKIKN
jgi:hypothetical protein